MQLVQVLHAQRFILKGMGNMRIRTFLIGTASGLALLSSAAHAQTSDTTVDTTAAAPQDDQEVVVTGFRASLAQAIETKRNADAIIDSVSAEDVGKFPNTNVAEALTLVPGVTVDRAFGQGEKVSILGTDPALNRTLLNGQTVASADWFILDSPGRTFNYALLAPQLVGRVDVYKSVEARIDARATSRAPRWSAGTTMPAPSACSPRSSGPRIACAATASNPTARSTPISGTA
jgi:hypothetical protein